MKLPSSVLFGCLLLGPALNAAEPATVHVFHHENVLGTSLELKAVTASPAEAERAEAAALAEIDRLAGILSTYDSASEASRWLRTTQSPVKVSPELFEVLGLFDQWRTRTAGALDAAAETISRLWQTAAAQGQPPAPAAIAEAVATVRQRHWSLDATARTATHLTAAPLVFNSFAKSYIASHACDAALQAANLKAMVVNIGGDLIVRGDLTETVGLADPRADAENDPPLAALRVRDLAVATSGDYRRGVAIGGRWYSHLVDPRTGQPAGEIISATVVAPAATDAGALATACCVLDPAKGLQAVAARPGAECLLITRDGRRLASAGWHALESAPAAASGDIRGLLATRQPAVLIDTAPAAPPTAAAPKTESAAPPAAPAGLWDENNELMVSLELMRFDGRRAARPFVAVWVEDADKYPVRTLALWFNGGRWLPDLRTWQHEEQLRALTEGTALTKSASSATRAPGKYTLKWDGKDNSGKLVKAGKYTVLIETAREHGTYQLIRQEMDFNGTPAKLELKANPEVSAASLDYHRKANGP